MMDNNTDSPHIHIIKARGVIPHTRQLFGEAPFTQIYSEAIKNAR